MLLGLQLAIAHGGNGHAAFWFAPAVIGLVVFLILRQRKAQELAGVSVVPAYSPPTQLTPAEAGMLIRDTMLACDVTATLMDLEQRGFLKIESVPASDADPKGDFNFKLLRKEIAWGDLHPHETTLLFQIFFGGELTTLSSLEWRFAAAATTFRRDVRNLLHEKALFRFEPLVPREYGSTAALLALGIGLYGAALGLDPAWWQWLLLAAFGGLLGALAFHAFEGDIRTAAGRKLCAQVRGYQEFIARVDAERLKTLPIETLGRNLPYAVALGVSQQWTASLNRLGQIGGSAYAHLNELLYDHDRLSNEINGMSYQTYNALMHAPHGGAEAVQRFVFETAKARRETQDPKEDRPWWRG